MVKKILILGAGHMGGWLADALCMDYEVAVYDPNKERLKYLFNVQRFVKLEEIKNFEPELLINAVSLHKTIEAFDQVMPYLPENCILSDITSVKNGLKKYYLDSGKPFVSTHPMFGPTFGNVKALEGQSAIIIQQSDERGKKFFRAFFKSLGLKIFEYTFIEHDETIAYSLSMPFTSTMVFAACMRKQHAPGTTFQKHMRIAKGLLSENDYLLTEILFNKYTLPQVEKIHEKLTYLLEIVKNKDSEEMIAFLNSLRLNIED